MPEEQQLSLAVSQDWIKKTKKDTNTSLPSPRNYDVKWSVPYGTRQAWIIGAKTTVLLRRFLRASDDVFDLQITRLSPKQIVPVVHKHRHWLNDVELIHDWHDCDFNPVNYEYFT